MQSLSPYLSLSPSFVYTEEYPTGHKVILMNSFFFLVHDNISKLSFEKVEKICIFDLNLWLSMAQNVVQYTIVVQLFAFVTPKIKTYYVAMSQIFQW